MREIKFRAWDLRRKEFLSGGQVIIAIQSGRNPKNVFYLDILKDPDFHKERFVLQQFTGLRDKNGKEIYEGDIIGPSCQDMPQYKGRVAWDSESGIWRVYYRHPKRDIEYQDLVPDFLETGDGMVVIGNIHENPELLQCSI